MKRVRTSLAWMKKHAWADRQMTPAEIILLGLAERALADAACGCGTVLDLNQQPQAMRIGDDRVHRRARDGGCLGNVLVGPWFGQRGKRIK